MSYELMTALQDAASVTTKIHARLDSVSAAIKDVEEALAKLPFVQHTLDVKEFYTLFWSDKRLCCKGKFGNQNALQERPLIECPAHVRLACESALPMFVRSYVEKFK